MKKKHILRTLVRLLAVALIFAAMPYTAIQVSAEDNLDMKCWMKYLPDTVPITEINMPGTHDSGTTHMGKAKFAGCCQGLSIPEQLEAGIRVLDIRVDGEDGNTDYEKAMRMTVNHNGFDASVSAAPWSDYMRFKHVLEYTEDFLKNNPTETVVLYVSAEGGDEDIAKAILYKFVNDYHHTASSAPCTDGEWIHEFVRGYKPGEKVPRLGEVRGKAVMILDDGATDDGKIPAMRTVTDYEMAYKYEKHLECDMNNKVKRILSVFVDVNHNDWKIRQGMGDIGKWPVFTREAYENMTNIGNPDVKQIGTNVTEVDGGWSAVAPGYMGPGECAAYFWNLMKESSILAHIHPGFRYGWVTMDYPERFNDFSELLVKSNYYGTVYKNTVYVTGIPEADKSEITVDVCSCYLSPKITYTYKEGTEKVIGAVLEFPTQLESRHTGSGHEYAVSVSVRKDDKNYLGVLDALTPEPSKKKTYSFGASYCEATGQVTVGPAPDTELASVKVKFKNDMDFHDLRPKSLEEFQHMFGNTEWQGINFKPDGSIAETKDYIPQVASEKSLCSNILISFKKDAGSDDTFTLTGRFLSKSSGGQEKYILSSFQNVPSDCPYSSHVSYDGENVELTLKNPGTRIPYLEYNPAINSYVQRYCGECKELTSSSHELNDGWYLVKTEKFTSLEQLKVQGDVKLILADGCQNLKITKGILVQKGSKLTIYAQSKDQNMGSLECGITSSPNAGIGSCYDDDKNKKCGDITIHGGKITAHGCKYGTDIGTPGIGGLDGTITIYGGEIEACGDGGAAGIGGGYKEESGTITIYGGTINAKTKGPGAGIGGGCMSNGGTITIYGGAINATGGAEAPGIGGGPGYKEISGTVTVYGGEINATGGKDAAGIGGGFQGYGCNVTVYGGNITASAGSNAEHAIGAGLEETSHGTFMVPDGCALKDNETGEIISRGFNQKQWLECGEKVSFTVVSVEMPPVKYLGYDENIRLYRERTIDKYTVLNVNSRVLQKGWYVLNESGTIEDITVFGDVHLILSDNCTLTVQNGINVGAGCRLSIYAQSEPKGVSNIMGKLIAKQINANPAAAIGSGKDEDCGRINIHGGTITAEGGPGAAGIGGGQNGSGGNVTFYGGLVTAIGGSNGAGIGAGQNGSGGTITFVNSGWFSGNDAVPDDPDALPVIEAMGAKVSAEGGSGATGIGGEDETIIIAGGKITATSGSNSAGIGGKGSSLTVNGGTVTATGETGGVNVVSGNVLIKGGIVMAIGKNETDGIIADKMMVYPTLGYDIRVRTENQEALSGSPFAEETDITEKILGHHEIYTKEVVHSYTVTFEMNSHGTQIDSQRVTSEKKATKPADPAEDGWIFEGWYVDSECKKAFDFGTSITKDTTIYAKWTQRVDPEPEIISISGNVIWKDGLLNVDHKDATPVTLYKNGVKSDELKWDEQNRYFYANLKKTEGSETNKYSIKADVVPGYKMEGPTESGEITDDWSHDYKYTKLISVTVDGEPQDILERSSYTLKCDGAKVESPDTESIYKFINLPIANDNNEQYEYSVGINPCDGYAVDYIDETTEPTTGNKVIKVAFYEPVDSFDIPVKLHLEGIETDNDYEFKIAGLSDAGTIDIEKLKLTKATEYKGVFTLNAADFSKANSDYYLHVYQIVGNDAGINYDEHESTVKVSVYYANGQKVISLEWGELVLENEEYVWKPQPDVNASEFTNKYMIVKDSIPVTVKWTDGKDIRKSRPESVKFTLYDENGQVGASYREVLGSIEDNEWKYSTEKLPYYKRSEQGKWLDKEYSVDVDMKELGENYVVDTYGGINGGLFIICTDKRLYKTKDFTIRAEWYDKNDKLGTRPLEIPVSLVSSYSASPDSKWANIDNEWKVEFNEVPVFVLDNEGNILEADYEPDTEILEWYNYNITFDEASGEYVIKFRLRDDVELWTELVPDQIYTGKAIKPEVRVYNGTKLLTKGKDYTLKYANNIRVGFATITVVGKGSYKGSDSVVFNINAKDVAQEDITVSLDDKDISAKNHLSKPVVKYGNLTLKQGRDYTVEYAGDMTREGVITATITGKGNFCGTRTELYRIYHKKFSFAKMYVEKIPNQVFTGERIYLTSDSLQVYSDINKTKQLEPGKDFTVSYVNNTNVGTAKVVIKGKGEYELYGGAKVIPFKIVPKELTGAVIKVVGDTTYSGGKLKPEIEVYLDGTRIAPKYYTVTYKNNVAVASVSANKAPTVQIKGRGNHSKVVAKKFDIEPLELKEEDVKVTIPLIKKKGEQVTVADVKLSVKRGKVTLKLGKDFIVDDIVPIDDTYHKVKISFTGNYKGNIESVARVYSDNIQIPLNIGDFTVNVTDMKHTGNAVKPKVEVIDNITGKKVNSKFYTITYANNIDLSNTAPTVTIEGKGLYKGSITKHFRIYLNDINKTYVAKIPNQIYTGNQVTISANDIKVYVNKRSEEPLTKDIDYTVEFDENVHVGKGTIVINGIGTYGGSKKVKFLILPKGVVWFNN